MNERQREFVAANTTDYSDLKALAINCTLKRSPDPSHTATLLDTVCGILSGAGASVEQIRTADHAIAPGVYPDMVEHGWGIDDWPQLAPKVFDADILIVGTPIWLGEKSSECTKLIERLYAHSGETNDKGQYRFYGKVGGCVVTGNEDGIKHVAMGVLYAMQHVGLTIPPQADCGWIGEAGPGLSYGDEQEDGGRAGFDNVFTQRNTTFMAFNLLHAARMLRDNGGYLAIGNVRTDWDAGCKPGWPNPEHR